ncbi:MAG TPA: hypothetical protein V6C88_12675 [Chroococcidiopsis sp.]
MVEYPGFQGNFQSSNGATRYQPGFDEPFSEPHKQNPAFATSPFQTVDFQTVDTASDLVWQATSCIRLDMEELNCFEVVDCQFQQWGVTFSNAIALHPSNPAYPPKSGKTVLMGSPKEGRVEATFDTPVRYVSGFVTSSRRTVMLAFDANGQPVARMETPASNLMGSDSAVPPNVQLSLQGREIHRVSFQAFDGQLTLDDFSFSY